MILAGWLFLWLMPVSAARFVGTMRATPWRSGAVGLLLLFAVPFAALLLVVSLVGLPVGLTIAALYAVALLVGIVVSALRIGEWEATVFRWAGGGPERQRRLALVAGVLTLAVLRALPVVGAPVVLLSVIFGLGALGVTLRRTSLTQTPAAMA